MIDHHLAEVIRVVLVFWYFAVLVLVHAKSYQLGQLQRFRPEAGEIADLDGVARLDGAVCGDADEGGSNALLVSGRAGERVGGGGF